MEEKEKDRIKIIRYIEQINASEVLVSDIENHSGAEKLRVFPILYEFFLSGILTPSSFTYLGVPAGYYVRQFNT